MNASHRPLLVRHQEEGYRVCDIQFNDEQRLKVGPLLDPAIKWVDYKPLAVSPGGTCIMGMAAGAARNTGPPPIMLPVGDDTIIRMDTVIYGDSSSRFEMLRRVFPDGSWFTVPLPRPPLTTTTTSQRSVSSISSYFVMGTSVWISVTGEGTFSLDVRLGASWRMEFPEELRRLEGRAFFEPELGAVVGLTGGDMRFLCSYMFEHAKDGSRTLTWHHTWSEAVPWECVDDHGWTPRSDMVGLAYLGHGRFCICRPVRQVGRFVSNMYSYLVLELRRRCLPDGNEIELARRGEVNYQGLFDEGYTRDLYFIQ